MSEEIKRQYFEKPGNMLYPLPAVMVSCGRKGERPNIVTIAWTGTICSDPPMAFISVRPERFSYPIIKETGEFVINLTNEALTPAMDYCGCVSGAKVDKFKECGLTPEESKYVSCPGIKEAPVSLECKVTQVVPLGSHDMFLAEVVGVKADIKYFDDKGVFHLEDAGLIAYDHGTYHSLGKAIGSFGYSVRKKK